MYLLPTNLIQYDYRNEYKMHKTFLNINRNWKCSSYSYYTGVSYSVISTIVQYVSWSFKMNGIHLKRWIQIKDIHCINLKNVK